MGGLGDGSPRPWVLFICDLHFCLQGTLIENVRNPRALVWLEVQYGLRVPATRDASVVQGDQCHLTEGIHRG
jgi:hypothetical protein